MSDETKQGFECKFFFKKEKLVDADGNSIGDGAKHPDVIAVLPAPQLDSVVEALQGPESALKSLLVDALENIVFLAGRQQIADWRERNEGGVFTPANFDLSKLTLEAIALLPKKSRGGYAPSKEELEAFVDDYKQVMLNVVKYDPKKVGVHCKNLLAGLSKLRDQKGILAKLREFLDQWAAHTEAMEDHSQVYEWYSERIARWLKQEEKDLEAAF